MELEQGLIKTKDLNDVIRQLEKKDNNTQNILNKDYDKIINDTEKVIIGIIKL